MPEPMPISPAVPTDTIMPMPGYAGNPGMMPLDGAMGMQAYPGNPSGMPPGPLAPGAGLDPRQVRRDHSFLALVRRHRLHGLDARQVG